MALRPEIDALVVGAGPVGLAAALTLVRDGHGRVEVLDEADRRTGLSYALALHPATLDVLARLGVAAPLIARGNRVDRVALYDGADRRAELDLAALDREHPYLLVVPQNELEAVLLAALAEAGVQVRWRHRLRHLEQSGGTTVACSIDRIDAESGGYAVAGVGGVVGKSFEREVRLVIGADGHASLVRRQLGIEREKIGAASTVAVFEIDVAAGAAEPPERDSRRELRITFVDGLRSVWWPLPGGRTRLGFELPADDGVTARRDKSRLPSIVPWLSKPLDEQRLRDLVATRMPWHGPVAGRLMWSAAAQFERALAASFGRGRVWLAGDAAHLAHPLGVASMNDGIVEAGDLAARCGRFLDGAEPLAALAAYDSDRLHHWRARLATADAEAALPAAVGGDAWVSRHAQAIVEALPVAVGEAAVLFAAAAKGGA